MGIGSKIKEYRNKVGLTQKELADELHVTYQAVSKWENDDAEPSFDTLKDLCGILKCTTDDLFGISKANDSNVTDDLKKDDVEKSEEIKPRQIIAVCEQCNKPIYAISNLCRFIESYSVRTGRTSHIENRQRTLCKECNEIRLLQEKRIEEQRKKQEQEKLRRRRVHSFIWPTLLSIVLLIVAIVSFHKGNKNEGITFLVLTVLGFTFLATMILNNTFLTDMWLSISSWGFIKMPGVIFSFSFDGLVFLIFAKIFLFLLGIVLALSSVVFSTIIALGLSIFVYPFAIAKNVKGSK